MDIILTLKKAKTHDGLGTTDPGYENVLVVSTYIKGKRVEMPTAQKHALFMNKIGILGITNGGLVLNMIKHNMERYKESTHMKETNSV